MARVELIIYFWP